MTEYKYEICENCAFCRHQEGHWNIEEHYYCDNPKTEIDSIADLEMGCDQFKEIAEDTEYSHSEV